VCDCAAEHYFNYHEGSLTMAPVSAETFRRFCTFVVCILKCM